jgi:uncharacterized protein YyaL (SSP411 family)
MATQHADTIIHEILRPNFSSYHLVNFSPKTGKAQAKLTNQGHADESTWTRGQAWAIMGFAQTYTWTKDVKYLDTAIGCAKYFLGRLREGEGKWHHPYVPVWDFDAPFEDGKEPLRDVSAGVIAANGLLIIHQALQSRDRSGDPNDQFYLDMALQIVHECLDMALDQNLASFEPVLSQTNEESVDVKVRESGFDAILRHSTSNNNEHAHKPYRDHGLVYADYYLLEFGNKLLRLGLV